MSNKLNIERKINYDDRFDFMNHHPSREVESDEVEKKLLGGKYKSVFKATSGENGKIFGSITSKEIATELKNQQDIEIDKKKILLKESIKETGVFNIEIKLYEGIIGKLKIDIVG